MAMSALRRAFQFFLSQGCRAIDALELARAERWADLEDVSVSWEYDHEPYDMGDAEDRMPSDVLGCVLTHPETREETGLWGIGDPTPEYRRLVQAQLAGELRLWVVESLISGVRQL